MSSRVTIRKAGGDDMYSWALFIDGRMVHNGMDKREAAARRDRAIKNLTQGRKWNEITKS